MCFIIIRLFIILNVTLLILCDIEDAREKVTIYSITILTYNLKQHNRLFFSINPKKEEKL